MAVTLIEHVDNAIKIHLDKGGVCIIDSEDLELISGYSWHTNAYGYAVAGLWNPDKKRNDIIFMHRIISRAKKGSIIDHVDGNQLNNQRSNLREATRKQNGQNRIDPGKANKSGVVGVQWCKPRNKWVAMIKVDYKSIYLGGFDKKEDAITARREAEKKYFGEFAKIEKS